MNKGLETKFGLRTKLVSFENSKIYLALVQTS